MKQGKGRRNEVGRHDGRNDRWARPLEKKRKEGAGEAEMRSTCETSQFTGICYCPIVAVFFGRRNIAKDGRWGGGF